MAKETKQKITEAIRAGWLMDLKDYSDDQIDEIIHQLSSKRESEELADSQPASDVNRLSETLKSTEGPLHQKQKQLESRISKIATNVFLIRPI